MSGGCGSRGYDRFVLQSAFVPERSIAWPIALLNAFAAIAMGPLLVLALVCHWESLRENHQYLRCVLVLPGAWLPVLLRIGIGAFDFWLLAIPAQLVVFVLLTIFVRKVGWVLAVLFALPNAWYAFLLAAGLRA